MNYTNFVNALWNSDTMLMQSDRVQLAFLRLTVYCTGQENGGRIKGCDNWTNKVWRDVVRVSLAVVKEPSPLWTWEGRDLIVAHYPIEQERMCRRLREMNRKKAHQRWLNDQQEGKEKPQAAVDAAGITSGNAKDKEKKDNERKEKEREQGGEALSPGVDLRSRRGAIDFPDEAAGLAAAQSVGCPIDFARLMWRKAAGRGGCDASNVPIRNWNAYLAVEWEYEEKRRKTPRADDARSVRERIRAAENQLDTVQKKLGKILSYAPDVFPAEHAAAEKKRAPLLAEKQWLIALLVELRQGIATQGGAA